jgi:hypothetical protein
MNETDEFIIDAFKQQGLATDELIAEIKAELDAEPDNEVGDRDLASDEYPHGTDGDAQAGNYQLPFK